MPESTAASAVFMLRNPPAGTSRCHRIEIAQRGRVSSARSSSPTWWCPTPIAGEVDQGLTVGTQWMFYERASACCCSPPVRPHPPASTLAAASGRDWSGAMRVLLGARRKDAKLDRIPRFGAQAGRLISWKTRSGRRASDADPRHPQPDGHCAVACSPAPWPLTTSGSGATCRLAGWRLRDFATP